jgi:putative hemolysin
LPESRQISENSSLRLRLANGLALGYHVSITSIILLILAGGLASAFDGVPSVGLGSIAGDQFQQALNTMPAIPQVSSEVRQAMENVPEINQLPIRSYPKDVYNPTQDQNPVIGLPNPASACCVSHGGRVDIRKTNSGDEIGYCILPDGTSCEEWEFYQKECQAPTRPDNWPIMPKPINPENIESIIRMPIISNILNSTIDVNPNPNPMPPGSCNQEILLWGKVVAIKEPCRAFRSGSACAFDVQVLKVIHEKYISHYKQGDIATVHFISDKEKMSASVGECLEICAKWDGDLYCSEGGIREISCSTNDVKCSPGPVGSCYCLNNEVVHEYQNEDCTREVVQERDCSSYNPPRKCENCQCVGGGTPVSSCSGEVLKYCLSAGPVYDRPQMISCNVLVHNTGIGNPRYSVELVLTNKNGVKLSALKSQIVPQGEEKWFGNGNGHVVQVRLGPNAEVGPYDAIINVYCGNKNIFTDTIADRFEIVTETQSDSLVFSDKQPDPRCVTNPEPDASALTNVGQTRLVPIEADLSGAQLENRSNRFSDQFFRNRPVTFA